MKDWNKRYDRKIITKKEIELEEFLVSQKREIAKRIKAWRERNKKYFKNWVSVSIIRTLRKSYGPP